MHLDGENGQVFSAILAQAGVELDLAHALAVERAARPCRWAEVNAAFMVHDDGAADSDVRAYLQRWGLMDAQLAAHLVRFIQDRTSRTYVTTYPAGYELCSTYVGGDAARFRQLLTEQIRVSDLLPRNTSLG